MRLYTVAVYSDGQDVEVINFHSESIMKSDKLIYSKQLEDYGYKMIRCIITPFRNTYTKNRLDALMMSFLAYKCTSSNLMKQLTSFTTSQEVLDSTRKCIEEVEYTYMKKIGRQVRRCLYQDIEVTDEIALECYNWVEDLREKEREKSWY